MATKKTPKKTAEEFKAASIREALLKLDKAKRSEILAAIDKIEQNRIDAEWDETVAAIEKCRKEKDIIGYIERLDECGDAFAGDFACTHSVDFLGFFKFILKQGAEIVNIPNCESVKFKMPHRLWEEREKILIRIIATRPTSFSIKKDVVHISWI